MKWTGFAEKKIGTPSIWICHNKKNPVQIENMYTLNINWTKNDLLIFLNKRLEISLSNVG